MAAIHGKCPLNSQFCIRIIFFRLVYFPDDVFHFPVISKYFRVNILVAIAAMIVLFFMSGQYSILVLIALIGFTCSSIFSLIFSMAIQARPEKANEISGLMVTGIFGGAVIPPLMGYCTDLIGTQAGSLIVILCCMCYLLYCSVGIKTRK